MSLRLFIILFLNLGLDWFCLWCSIQLPSRGIYLHLGLYVKLFLYLMHVLHSFEIIKKLKLYIQNGNKWFLGIPIFITSSKSEIKIKVYFTEISVWNAPFVSSVEIWIHINFFWDPFLVFLTMFMPNFITFGPIAVFFSNRVLNASLLNFRIWLLIFCAATEFPLLK